ncbi:phosphomevalonate kinase [Lactiplantibacillus plantarum]|nr:phosphomevalonate kinase [Lactiplantibacillus plantarum]
MITVKAPGKLYIAGEYAVVESGYPAIIVALDQFVTATISPSETIGSIVSEQYQENSIVWRRQGDAMVFDNRDNPFHYILAAISYTESYAHELGRDLGYTTSGSTVNLIALTAKNTVLVLRLRSPWPPSRRYASFTTYQWISRSSSN